MSDTRGASDRGGRCEVFLSHAGAQKKNFVSVLYTVMKSAFNKEHMDSNTIFLDDKCLTFGNQRGGDNIIQSLDEAVVVVFVLCKNFIKRRWPMLELITTLERHRRAPNSVCIAPVFDKLSWEEANNVAALYEAETCWEGADVEKPNERDLRKWIEALQDLCKFSGFRRDQANGWEGDCAEQIAAQVVRHVRHQTSHCWDVAVGEGHERLECNMKPNKGTFCINVKLGQHGRSIALQCTNPDCVLCCERPPSFTVHRPKWAGRCYVQRIEFRDSWPGVGHVHIVWLIALEVRQSTPWWWLFRRQLKGIDRSIPSFTMYVNHDDRPLASACMVGTLYEQQGCWYYTTLGETD